MFTFLIVLTIIAAVLLVLVVLAQNPKGGGLSSQFGGEGSSQIMGVKRTNDLLEKATWGLAIAILVFCMTSFVFINNRQQQGGDGLSTPGMEKANEQNIMDLNPNTQEPLGVGADTATQEGSGLEGLMED